MQDSYDPNWLQWARQLQAIAQNGLTYAQSHYDIERYKQVREVAAEIMATGAGIDSRRVLDLFSQETGYATPKIDSRGVVFRNDALLLVRELADDGRWTLPGGWADPNESPAEAVVREVWEETGYETRATRLLAVYDRSKHPHVPPHPYHVYKLFFQCDLVGGVATHSHETGESAFFRSAEIPELSLSRVTPGQVARLFVLHEHPDWPTDFD
jgi:ADP-ribose pyrophosphatase YjhB (NUDIX family)